MKKTLRPYQLQAVQTIKERLKATTHPLLVTASVGAGKSLIIAEIVRWIEQSNYRALCLTLNSTLIQQNADTYKGQGGHCGIYVGSLDAYETEPLVIFGSPQSVCNGIRNKNEISNCRFNIIIVDECHNIDPHNMNTMYQRIINHYGSLAQSEQYSYRVIGLTGTPYRGKGNSIIGPDQFFREEVCNISTSWLISEGYLTKPEFGLCEAQGYDFSQIRVNSMGKFSGAELQAVIDSNARLTGSIMMEIQAVMKNHAGAFVFAVSKKHCEECLKSLPQNEARIITGDTPHEERKRILEGARMGQIKYLVSVNCLLTGIDVTNFDICAFLRPTESLVLYVQAIGRALRLHSGKSRALILDYAGNLERHGDIDNPIINAALQPKEGEEDEYVIPCLECRCLNKIMARRCIGLIPNDSGTRRCDNYFTWKDCPNCAVKNDSTARACRVCDAELIDPNAKLRAAAAKPDRETFAVTEMKCWVNDNNGIPVFYAMFKTTKGILLHETFSIRDSRMKNLFYGMFVKHHVVKPSEYYPVLESVQHLRKMISDGVIRCPDCVEVVTENGKYKIKKKIFFTVVDSSHFV